MGRKNKKNPSKTRSCTVCHTEDNSRMVQCDKCHNWNHFDCAGVSEDVENRSWYCQSCTADKPVSARLKNRNARKDIQAGCSGEYPNEEPNDLESTAGSSSHVSLCSTPQRCHKQPPNISEQVELQLRLLEERKALESRYLEERFEILMRAAKGVTMQTEEPSSLGVPKHHSSPVPNNHSSSVPNQHSSPGPNHHSLPVEQSNNNPLPVSIAGFDPILLNRSQATARQAVSKELPSFNGNPEEWPLFLATFESSTKMCGYTAEENMLRLQRCLGGKARESVRSQLLHPSNVDGVISTLEMLYGRPEYIINTLIQKIRSLPAPKEDKFETLVDFAIAVRNMVATVKACKIDDYLYNASLRQELVERLPPMIKLTWAVNIKNIPRVTLEEFSDWLYSLAEAASAVTDKPYTAAPETKRKGRKDDGFLNAHHESFPMPDTQMLASQQFHNTNFQQNTGCVICQNNCESLDKCTTFTQMNLPSRWASLRNANLCRCCLKRHRGACRRSIPCGVNGCSAKHHPLMHNNSSFNPLPVSSNPEPQPGTSSRNVVEMNLNTHRSTSSHVLFRYVPVILHNNGTEIYTYAFLDDGSSLTLLEEDLAKELKLEGISSPLCIYWTADTHRYEDSSRLVSLQISGVKNRANKIRLSEVHTVKRLKLPPQSLDFNKMAEQYHHLQGLPIKSYQCVRPRILIGINNVRVTLALDSREGKIDQPVATKTRLGWVLCGRNSDSQQTANDVSHLNLHAGTQLGSSDSDLHNLVKYFFTLESIGIAKTQQLPMSKEDEQALKTLIQDYVNKGYARKLSQTESEAPRKRIWYLPMFPVFNPNKPGKLRVVWDAAATTNGISLNSLLLKGPDQLTELPAVLYKFREHRVAIGGDLREMFHQVLMKEDDQHCQRFLWRNNEHQQNPDEYVLQVMSFGATCSPSCAIFVKNENADRFKTNYPAAVDAIKGHYVDDMLLSVETEEEAIKIAKEVHYIHWKGGFEMRNWISNSSNVLSALGADPVLEKNLNIATESANEKVLGMWWSTNSDLFSYKVYTKRNEKILLEGNRPTKRELLSTCYRLKTSNSSSNRVQLHTFVDASENGIAAVSYFRFEENGTVETSLVTAKSRVAPLKFVSIPRLELQAAVVGCRLAKSVEKGHTYKISKRYFWTDARDVLFWLRSDHRRFSPFVANRVSEILEDTDLSEWKWVPTKLNVADEATKWKCAPSFDGTSRWFCGPQFLLELERDWPTMPDITPTNEELRPTKSGFLHHISSNDVGWARYPGNIRKEKLGEPRQIGPASGEELARAANYLYRNAQREYFTNEWIMLKSNNTIPKSSSLYKVEPYLDESEVMRIRGRLGAFTGADNSFKHPIILPRKHRITLLVMYSIHVKFRHQMHQAVINETRSRYYIPRLRSVYKDVKKYCQFCKNRTANPIPPRMSDLPPSRLAVHARPFSFMGVDYFGPMLVTVGRRVEKRWGVLATCLTTRGVHIEIAHSLTTSSCIMAIRNVMARRGIPVEIISDRGTNFIGASKELKLALNEVNQEKIVAEFSSEDTKWSFNPPASPHMGGSWERLIQTVKRVLAVVFPTQRLPSDEVLRNALIEIENILNSRPLTYVPIDSESEPALTPNSFLQNSSTGCKPLVQFDDSGKALRRTWMVSQAIANAFWKRWVAEYLPEITRRSKWFSEAKPIKKGDIVVVVDPDSPRNCWPKGRVIDTKLAADGQVRSAVVQTVNGILERPALKLAVLDIGANDSDPDPGLDTGGDCDTRLERVNAP
ncbi:uncharacterized protein LOC129752630 [Uranotaenia lowii]|uniref:uncharacterized protein LOC129752630 n=1 Tax=Uranotaenia lowii TaxID=190385 RepID=UPI002478FF28|nr:uncharacterized protein LOC129752630 [Uranotaenia lowii]